VTRLPGPFGSVIGVGGQGAEAEGHDAKRRKLNWIGVGAHKTSVPGAEGAAHLAYRYGLTPSSLLAGGCWRTVTRTR
jgi:hypothetical protein